MEEIQAMLLRKKSSKKLRNRKLGKQDKQMKSKVKNIKMRILQKMNFISKELYTVGAIAGADLEVRQSNTEESVLFYKRRHCFLLKTPSVILPYF